ncbi:hypersensitive reaction associated Ca2+-bindingfamily protein [Striga asiatica]|uniref:Hypersensitive reaction associated Ca2+-bindingfamily protein n=1 Tax=Striga asiatica TaxID=4170 RepID=A0A5A7PRV0_STRAF|nr:hypersensitive reaction associated Ca2+-bindingfamily protein [Striga asiatica]
MRGVGGGTLIRKIFQSKHTRLATKPHESSSFSFIQINSDELRSFYDGFLGIGRPDDEANGSMISIADSYRNGYIEYDEFQRELNRRNGNGRFYVGIIEDAFWVMDKMGIIEEAFWVMDKDIWGWGRWATKI